MNNKRMKKRSHEPYRAHYLITVLLTTLFLLPSCDKTPVNGPLDGHWQLTSIETPDGIRQAKDSLVFLSIQLQIAQWDSHKQNLRYYSHFTHQGDSLLFFDLVHPSAHTVDDTTAPRVTAKEVSEGGMDAWGIHTLNIRFRVQTLSHNSLILEKADTLLRFRKF